MKIISKIFEVLSGRRYEYKKLQKQLGYFDPTAHIDMPDLCSCPSKIFLYENACIRNNARFIISVHGDMGKFIMKKNSGAAAGLTVITGNHSSVIGETVFSLNGSNDMDKDLIVNEDVWIGANAVLACGCELGRGSIIGAGSVVRNVVPPYAVVVGNPAKIVGFRFSPEEIIEHEKTLYPEEERLPLELLEKNYKKYFLDHIKEIKAYTGLICK